MATFDGTTGYTVNAGAVVNGSTTYVVESDEPPALFFGTTDYVVEAPASPFTFYKRVGTSLQPVQLGKRRGSVIDWLSPDLPA